MPKSRTETLNGVDGGGMHRKPEIQLTKYAGPVTETGPRTFTVPVSLTLENTGYEDIRYVQITDDIDIFGEYGRTITVNNVRAAGGGFSHLTLNPSFDGLTDIRLLTGTDSLARGEKARVSFDFEFTCEPGSGPFENVAEATARGAKSHEAVGALGRAEIACSAEEQPELPVPGIELQKVAGEVTALGTDQFSVPITLMVTNTGEDVLVRVQIDDPLELFGSSGQLLGVTDLSASGLTIDPDFDGSSETAILAGIDSLDPGASGNVSFTVMFDPGTEPGPFVNAATGSATGEDSGKAVSDTAEASIALPAPALAAGIDLIGFASPVEPRGDGTYSVPVTLWVTNTGEDALVGVQIEDPLELFGPSGQLLGVTDLSALGLTVDPAFDGSSRTAILAGTDRLDPGARGSVTFTIAFAPGREPGPFLNRATATATAEGSGTVVSDAAAMAITLVPSNIVVVKTGDRGLVSRGEAVGYDVRVENEQDLPVFGVELSDDLPAGFQLIDGSASLVGAGADGRLGTPDDQVSSVSVDGVDPVIFGPFDIEAGGSVVIRYATRVGTGVGIGEHQNCATAFAAGSSSNTSCWTVGLIADPIFERTTVIGKVFEDHNRDGWQDPDEPGIPGVRLVTVGGLLIETDVNGRYHIADVDVARFERGANFILKLDAATLPPGAQVISENPRVIRVTEAVMARMNFAVAMPDVPRPQPRPMICTTDCTTLTTYRVTGHVPPVRFGFGDWQIPDDYVQSLNDLLAQYSDKQNVRVQFVGHADIRPVIPGGSLALRLGADGQEGNQRLSEVRAEEVCRLVRDELELAVDCTLVEGRGETEPVVAEDTEAARALNRRVETELLYDESEWSRETRVLTTDTCLSPELTGPGTFGRPSRTFSGRASADEHVYCSARVDRSEDLGAVATGISVSGGPFGCNAVAVGSSGPTALPGRAAPGGENTVTVVASDSGTGQEYCGHGIVAGAFPVEVRTLEGSVHHVNRTGDVLRIAYPSNNQWIVVSPSPDSTDGSTITALRISNLGVAQAPALDIPQRTTASVWHTIDSEAANPRLDILAMNQALVDSDGRLAADVRFAAYTNYDAFVEAFELEIYGRSDADGKLLRTISLDAIDFDANIRFDGRNPDGVRLDLAQFTQLEYTLKAYDCVDPDGGEGCHIDATEPRVLRLIEAESEAEGSSHEPEEVWGKTSLAAQHIPVRGSRVRIHGADLDARRTVRVKGRRVLDSGVLEDVGEWVVPIGSDKRFVLEQFLPVGRYDFSIATHVSGLENLDSATPAQATRISVSGGGFGCARSVSEVLPGRERDGLPLDASAVMVTARPEGTPLAESGECPEGRSPLQIESAEGTVLQITSAGEIVRESEARNNQRIVVTPYRDETDPAVISALRISNEGVDPSYVEWRKNLDIEVAERNDFFLVALANLTVGQNDVSGNVEPLAADDHFDGTTFADGRVALYAKGKIHGRYLLTAQLDSTEDELSNLGDNLRREDPRRLFRQLDPDRYYPVYGDDSTTTTDVDTQGALYLRLDWDHNRALWGNFNTGMTDTEFMQYNRSLYGAQLSLETEETTEFGDTERELTVFGSQAQSAAAHVTFEATGGSLYYLQHTDIVEGSEKVWVEVRRRDTQQVLERNVFIEGRDYEVDALQGRIILRRPLSQVVLDRGPSIIRTRPLEGDDVYLLVDYEYVPRSFMAEDLTYGGRGKVWITDHVGVGATQVVDERDGLDYDLSGLDLTLRAGPGTYLNAEVAQSEATQSGANLISSDGGLSFRSQSLAGGSGIVEGDAVAIEGRLSLADFNEDLDGDIRAWSKRRDRGFSTGRLDDGIETTDTGLEANWRAGENFSVSAGFIELERELVSRERTARVQAEGRFDRITAGVEIRREELERLASDPVNRVVGLTPGGSEGEAVLVGARVGYELTDATTIYGAAQTATDETGAYQENDLVSLGVNTRLNDTFGVSLEASDGDRGSALTTGVDYSTGHGLNFNLSGGVGPGAISQFATSYSVADGHALYGSYAVDPDRTYGQRNLLTLGQRRALGNRFGVFSESQFGKDDRYAGVGHVFGLDFDGIEDWRISGSIHVSENDNGVLGFERTAASLGAYRQTEDLKFASRIEIREDEGDGLHTRQYVTTNSFTKIVDASRRWLGNLNISWTDDEQNSGREAGFAEFELGYAHRPIDNDRVNLIAKYGFLYDLPTEGQATARPDERSHLVSLDAIYAVNARWEIGGKFAFRRGERRASRDSGPWHEFGLRLTAVNVRYHMNRKWDALAEYRWLSDTDGDSTRSGALLGLYRHLGDQFKVGVGYNFTDYDDDLRNDGYDNRGWFLDLIGKY